MNKGTRVTGRDQSKHERHAYLLTATAVQRTMTAMIEAVERILHTHVIYASWRLINNYNLTKTRTSPVYLMVNTKYFHSA